MRASLPSKASRSDVEACLAMCRYLGDFPFRHGFEVMQVLSYHILQSVEMDRLHCTETAKDLAFSMDYGRL